MKTITIKSNDVGRYDDVSPFIIESGALELKIELPQKSGEFYFVAELNGKSIGARLISHDGTVALENLQAGELKAAVKHYLRGELIEAFKIEPLLLKAVDKELSAMPEIARLTGEIAALHEQLTALTNSAEEHFAEAQERQCESNAALISFAYTVYENSPLINSQGLTFAEFAEALGFEGTEKIKFGGKL